MNNQNDLQTNVINLEDQNKNILGNYKLEKTIGTGTFGKVKLGIHIPTGEMVAIKILDKSRINIKEDLDRIMREMKFLKNLDHQNIIKVFEILEDDKYFFIVMEYAECGELFNYIVKKKRLTENEVNYFFYQIINGLEYIHKNKVAHRDMKPENLLITDDVHKIIKIIDFGLSNDSFENKKLQTPCGSPCYAAPEMIKGLHYSGVKIDIWSTGIILFAMACGYLPFEDKVNEVLFKKIIECKIEFPNYISFSHKDLIRKILVTNPNERITFEEIKKHSVYNKGKNYFLKQNKIYSEIFLNEKKIKDYVINQVSQFLKISIDEVETFLVKKKYDVTITPLYEILFKKVIKDKELLRSILKDDSRPFSPIGSINFNDDMQINYFNNVQCVNINVNYSIKTDCNTNEKIQLNKIKELITKKLNIKRPDSLNINYGKKFINMYNNDNKNPPTSSRNNPIHNITKISNLMKYNCDYLNTERKVIKSTSPLKHQIKTIHTYRNYKEKHLRKFSTLEETKNKNESKIINYKKKLL